MDQVIADATGIVLAGGASSRFGSDKALAAWGEGTMVESVCAALLEVLPRVLVVAKPGQVRPAFDPRVSVVRDLRELRHPLSGLEAGLAACPTPWAFALACDMPFTGAALVRRLAAERDGVLAVAARCGGRDQPWGAFYSREVLPPLREHLKSRGSATAFLAVIRTRRVEVSEAGNEFFDLDDQAAYQAARALPGRLPQDA